MAKAGEDIDGIYRYILEEAQDQETAARIAEEIRIALMRLEQFPESGSYVRGRREQYRKVIVRKYIAVYSVDYEARTVTIVRIFHGAMNYTKYL